MQCSQSPCLPAPRHTLRSQAFFGSPAVCSVSNRHQVARAGRRSARSTTCKAQDASHSVICFGEALFGMFLRLRVH